MKRTFMTAMTMIAAAGVAHGNELQAKECAIFASASAALVDRGQTVQGLLADCPMHLQVANADITRLANPPRYQGRVAGELHQTLMQRGVPKDMADQIAMSRAFGDWVNLRTSAL